MHQSTFTPYGDEGRKIFGELRKLGKQSVHDKCDLNAVLTFPRKSHMKNATRVRIRPEKTKRILKVIMNW